MAFHSSAPAYLTYIFLLVNLALCKPTVLDRTGWTATADSFEPGYDPAQVLDQNNATSWQSKSSPTPAPLPHWITVDMKSQYNIVAISMQPISSNVASNGRVGGHLVETSTDNKNWQLVASGTYANDATIKTTRFGLRPARYVRLTATSEAQGTGTQLTSIAEFNVLTDLTDGKGTPYTPQSPSKGIWQKTVDFPLVPVSAALLLNGKLLLWAAFGRDRFGLNDGYTQTVVYNPSSGELEQFTITNTEHEMFCPGISADMDGRVVVTGGSDAARTSIYDPSSSQWISGPDMNIKRGYQSSATCSDGRIFTIGGSWNGGQGGKNGEIYTPRTNTWSLLPGALVQPMLTADPEGIYRQDNHAMLFGWTNKTVFQAGPSTAMNWYDTVGNGSVTPAGPRLDDQDSMCGIAVMYDAPAGKILVAGGAPAYQDSDAHDDAYVLSIGALKHSVPVVKTASMAYARSFANGIVLPDGTVFVTGGQTRARPFFDETHIQVPELWDPKTGVWTPLNPMAVPRVYHSVALLLPDATVFNAGGGLCGECRSSSPTDNHFDAETFVPPYLLNADGSMRKRPAIVTVAASVKVGGTLSVTTESAVTAFSLIRLGTATHTVNTDQRRIPLTPKGNGTSFKVTVPADAGVALPGWWMLFAIDASGTPSVAKFVQVTL